MSLRTPLSRVRGLGSAKEGAHHWTMQRATAIALIPLVLYMLTSVVAMVGAPYETVRAFLAQPLTATVLLLLVLAGLWHIRLGLQVVVEDYIHKESSRVFLLLLINGTAFIAGALALLSVLRLYVTG